MSVLIILTATYTTVILILNRVMKNMVWDLENEIKSINCQFFVFLFAYITRCVYLMILLLKPEIMLFGMRLTDLLYLFTILFCQIIPTFIVLLLHHKAFNKRKTVSKEINTSTQPLSVSSDTIKTNDFDYISESSSFYNGGERNSILPEEERQTYIDPDINSSQVKSPKSLEARS